MFTGIDHVAVLVPNMDDAIQLYNTYFGMEFCIREVNEKEGYEVVIWKIGGASLELLSPTRPDSKMAAILSKRGPGLHHIGLNVDHIDQCMEDLKAKGLRLTSDIPVPGTDGSKINFIHPKSLLGTLLEIVEKKK